MMKQVIIRILLLTLFVTLLGTVVGGQVLQNADIDGNWTGTIEVSGIKLRLTFKISKTADGYGAKFDSTDQGMTDLDVDTVTREGDLVRFEAKKFGFTYEGKLNPQGDELSGTFRQGAATWPLVLKRVTEVPKLNRPQDPQKPYPYNEEEVSYRNEKDNVKLAGTLTLPRTSGKHPAVILISGSGSQDRNETVAGHRPFLVLSDHLTRNGIAVLRVDDRGAGGSDLGSLTATSENYAEDVLAGIRFLKSRQEINPKQIGLIGHSEGGMIAPMVAAQSNDVAFIVLLAGMGQRGEDVIYTQTELIQKAEGMNSEVTAKTLDLLKRINAIVKTQSDEKRLEQLINEEFAAHVGALTEPQRKAFAPAEATLKGLMPMFRLPWFRYFITFDPSPFLRKVKVPVLALNGELDLQVAWKENLGLIAAALKAGGNKDNTITSFPNLNHLFQTSKTGSLSEYGQIEETMSPDVLKTISDWILRRTN
jgi:uncharacterized protein